MEEIQNLGMLSQEVLWGVPVWKLGAALLIIFLGFLSRKVISSIFNGIFKRRAEESANQWDDDITQYMPRPLALVAQILLWHLAVLLLEFANGAVGHQRVCIQWIECCRCCRTCMGWLCAYRGVGEWAKPPGFADRIKTG